MNAHFNVQSGFPGLYYAVPGLYPMRVLSTRRTATASAAFQTYCGRGGDRIHYAELARSHLWWIAQSYAYVRREP